MYTCQIMVQNKQTTIYISLRWQLLESENLVFDLVHFEIWFQGIQFASEHGYILLSIHLDSLRPW